MDKFVDSIFEEYDEREFGRLRSSIRKIRTSITYLKKELKDLKDTVEFIEIFLGEHYAELKKLNSQFLEKDE